MGSRAVGWIVAEMCMGMRRLDGSGPRCGRLTPVGRVRPGCNALAALVAAALALGACGGQRSGERPPPTVGVVTIEAQPVTLTTELPGRTSPYEIADVRPQVGGIIQARLFTEGSIVQAGQVLYQIEPAPFQAAYDQAKGAARQRRGQPRHHAAEGRALSPPGQAEFGRQAGLRRRRGGVQAGRRPRSSRTRRRRRRRGSISPTPRSPRRSPAGSASRPSPKARWSPPARPPRSTPSSGSIRSMSTSPSRPRRCWRCAGRSRPAAWSAPARSSAEAHLTLDDGSQLSAGRPAAVHRRHGRPDHRRGDAAGRLPQSRGPAAARHVRARHGHRGRRSGRPPGRRSRASAATRRASRPRWWSNGQGVVELRQLHGRRRRSAIKWLVTSGLAPGDRRDRRGRAVSRSRARRSRAVPADNAAARAGGCCRASSSSGRSSRRSSPS